MTDAKKYINKLSGARVLIIGGSSGMGYGVAEASIENGATVIISSSSESKVRGAVAKLGETYPSAKSRISGYACNLGDLNTLEENVASLFEKVGTLNHVVYTAGDSLGIMSLESVDIASIQKAGTVRYFGTIMVAKYAAKYLTPGPESSLTLTTGSVSERPIKGWSIVNGYATGLHGLVRGFALDLEPIRVNGISPGAVLTPLWDNLGPEQMEQMMDQFKLKSTTGTIGKVEDVAEAFLYVMKDQNVTGTLISSNGGGLLK
jgi:NAD(P)-dependent dehydrogenase (short-subunit alcohol dehydrogenase family)